ncbi:MAG TPA: serine/threonine-protein kinase [Nevskiaceae bacterium]|nr:serine/threonine-protein kinase [Nevskiaceae bacterium]
MATPEPAAARTAGGTPISKLGKYDIVGELGRGSFGVVYKGVDPFVEREVAIKVADVADDRSAKEIQDAFFAEARAGGRLQHPYIVTLFDAGVEGNHTYLVMEYIAGETLKRFTLRDSPRLKLETACNLMLKCALALDYIHKQGVLHKDIKPGNIMVTKGGIPKIMDFSISAVTRAGESQDQTLAGSPLYIAPELLHHKPPSAASDLYSLGVVLYLLLTGEPPFTAREATMLFQQIKHLPPIPLKEHRRDIPDPLADIVMRLLDKDPAKRHASGRELAEDLSPYSEQRKEARRKGLNFSHDSLRKLEFFKAFKSRELGELMDASESVTVRAGNNIITEGDTDNALYILMMGVAEVRKGGHLMAMLEKGDCFGEIGFLYAVKRTATVTAHTDVMVLKVNSELLETMSQECQLRYYKIFCENLILRLTMTTEKASQVAGTSDDSLLDFTIS